ncbi:MAG: SUMF1/EgtB/PvdO family nonheme iron enzyme [Lentisphaeria bacterium]|nr:SUMF1/EgtB/PvdO family nonheme iron enzyme [Lentisphaeria bacterium]
MFKRLTLILTLFSTFAVSAAEMVPIPGGSFTMGSANGGADEKPHTVTVSPFLIDRCEVTQAEYAALTGTNPAKFKGDTRPVECLRWHDAARFCNARSKKEGLKPCYNEETWECDFSADGYRLPTEAEWEYACRAGNTDALPKGDLKQYAWMRSNSQEKTHPVGTLKPNAWGICDMYGNVAEWCNDWYAPELAGGNDPRGPETGEKKVLRGGSWKDRPKKISSSRRDKDDPATADICQGYDNYGFRCVRRVKGTKDAAVTPTPAPVAPAPPEVFVPPAPDPATDDGKPLFQSWEFLLFFLPLLVLYVTLRRTKLRTALILVGSYVFYAWWDWRFPLFLAVVTVSDYLIARGMEHCGEKGRKWLVAESCIINLGILCSFKYLHFITENVIWLFGKCGVTLEVPEFSWLLPVGLSFFTFKSLSYTCDVGSGKLRAEKNFINYAAYVAFFPQIVAGPIERAQTLLPQLRHAMPLKWSDLSAGISIFVSGLFKKVVMADLLAAYADPVFTAPGKYGGLALLCAAVAFSWQIYFDFSGYSDMARGVARALGFRTIINFDNPYVAVDVRDFWRRWHISLSSWFRDYVYIPLGGSRRVKIRVWWNVLVTMLVSGLWHGAAWTFVIWGGANGVGSVVSSTFDKSNWYQRIPKLLKQIAVFIFMAFTWVFFRSANLDVALTMLRGIVKWQKGLSPVPTIPFLILGVIWIYQLVWASRFRPVLESRPARMIAVALVLLAIFLLGSGANTQFIYQQF